MRYLYGDKSRFQRCICVYDEIFALFQAFVGNFDTIPPWKVVGTLYLDIAVTLNLNILLS